MGTKKGQNLAFYPKFLVEATGLEPNPITCVGAQTTICSGFMTLKSTICSFESDM